MAQTLFIARDNKTLGPFPEEKVRELYNKGKISPDDHVWSEGFDSWKAAKDYFGPQSSPKSGSRPVSKMMVPELDEQPVPVSTPAPRATIRKKEQVEEEVEETPAQPKKNRRNRDIETIDINGTRSESESTWTIVAYIFAGLFWGILACVLLSKSFFPLINGQILEALLGFLVALAIAGFFLGSIMLSMYISELFFRAKLYGESVLVSKKQYAKLYSILRGASDSLGLAETPLMFVVNSSGSINALAIRFLSSRYVILYGSLVDLYLENNDDDALRYIIGHELGHHAAGHCHWFRETFLGPAKLVPIVGLALSRAREFTADRLGFLVAGSIGAAGRALMGLAHGSKALGPLNNIEAFEHQENERPALVAFMDQLFQTHPRLTLRIKKIQEYSEKL